MNQLRNKLAILFVSMRLEFQNGTKMFLNIDLYVFDKFIRFESFAR